MSDPVAHTVGYFLCFVYSTDKFTFIARGAIINNDFKFSFAVSEYNQSKPVLLCASKVCLNKSLSITSESSTLLFVTECQTYEFNKTLLTNIESLIINPV